MSEEIFETNDLGDATVETKQVSPVPPYYFDSTFGHGWRPNG
jgi:hypothetical protein